MAAVLEITVPSKGRGRARGRARKMTDEREIRPGLASLTQEKGNHIISNTTEDITQKSKGSAILDLACGQDTDLSMSLCAATIKNSDSTKSSTLDVKLDQHSSICTQKEHRPRSERSRFDTLVTSQINHYLGQNNNMHASFFSSSSFRKENLDSQSLSENSGDEGKMRSVNTSIKAAHHREVMSSAQVSSRNNAQHLSHRSSPGLKLKIPPRYGAESFTDAKTETNGGLKITEHPCATTVFSSSEGERCREEKPGTLGSSNICRLSQSSPPPDPLFKGMHDTRGASVAVGRGRGRGRGRGHRSDTEYTAHHGKVWDTDIKCPPQSEVIEQFEDAESTSGFSKTVGGGLWKNKSLVSSSALGLQLSPLQTQTSTEMHKNKANSETLKKRRRPRRSRRETKEKRSEKTSLGNDIHNIDRLSLDADKWPVRHKLREVSDTKKVGLLDTTAEVGGDQSSPGLMSTPPGHVKVLDWAAEVSTPLANPSPEWPASDQSVQSPDTLKTPPGHVKVLDWAAEMASPVSPSPCPDWGF